MSAVKSRHGLKFIPTRPRWISAKDMQKYYKAVDYAFAMNQVIDGVFLDNYAHCNSNKKSNKEYKRDILECYRKALETVPMPSETPT